MVSTWGICDRSRQQAGSGRFRFHLAHTNMQRNCNRRPRGRQPCVQTIHQSSIQAHIRVALRKPRSVSSRDAPESDLTISGAGLSRLTFLPSQRAVILSPAAESRSPQVDSRSRNSGQLGESVLPSETRVSVTRAHSMSIPLSMNPFQQSLRRLKLCSSSVPGLC